MIGRALAFTFSLPIHLYRYTLRPLIGSNCRFHPSCSQYTLEALRRRGPIIGLWLTARRLARCHPWGGSGFDPVPDPPGQKEQ